jgi:hypothetical protein
MFPADFVFLGALAITIGCTFYFKPRIKGNRGGVPSVHIAESDEGLMMLQYRTWTLLALLVLTLAKGQTPDATPRVQGLFRYGPETCKKRCADDAACFNECRQHEITPAELKDIIDQQKQQPRK